MTINYLTNIFVDVYLSFKRSTLFRDYRNVVDDILEKNRRVVARESEKPPVQNITQIRRGSGSVSLVR